MSGTKKYYTTKQAAEVLRVAPSTVRRWVNEGHLHAEYQGSSGKGNSYLFLRSYIDDIGYRAVTVKVYAKNIK